NPRAKVNDGAGGSGTRPSASHGDQQQRRRIRMKLATAAAVAALALADVAQAATPDWEPLGWLVGDWVGEGGGAMTGKGGFSFLPDNDGHLLIRRNVADYPPQNGKPALH